MSWQLVGRTGFRGTRPVHAAGAEAEGESYLTVIQEVGKERFFTCKCLAGKRA